MGNMIRDIPDNLDGETVLINREITPLSPLYYSDRT